MPKPKPMQQGSPHHFQTPPHALDPLFQFLPAHYTVWECAAGQGNLVRAFQSRGFSCVGTDILTGEDYFSYEPKGHYDCIITNPPFDLKQEFLARSYALKKPFALLMPLTGLEGIERQRLYREHGLQLVCLPKRLNFETPNKAEKSSSWFATAWFTWGLRMPSDLVFWQPK